MELLMSKSKTYNCVNCGVEHTTPNKHSAHAKYCSQKCQNDFQHKVRIEKWKNGEKTPGKATIKRYLAESKSGCWECGIEEWNGKPIVLELEHIDGNSDNNEESNLSLLCPNCHSQTPTYKSRNRGNGRHYRRVRYAEGKSF